MIPDAILNQIQDRLDIVEIISATVPLKRAGRNFKAPCPFHQEKTPSFMVSPDKQIFHCFGCGAGGNVFGFLMKQEQRDFRDVVETLADRVGVEIPKDKKMGAEQHDRTALYAKANQLALDHYRQVLWKERSADKARKYLKDRGILEAAAEDFKLGYAAESWDGLYRALEGQVPDGVLEKTGLVLPRKEGGFYDRFRQRIIFPILDAKGVCVAFGGRVLDDALPKYLNSPESEIYSKGRHLYGLFQARKAIRDYDAVIVVEGYMDLIACHQAGVENVVASLGTALTVEQVRLVKRHTKNALILYDADKAGELATLRGLELFLEEGLEVKVLRLEKGHDPDSFIKAYGSGRFKEALTGALSLFDYKLAFLSEKFDRHSLEGKVRIANEMVTLFSKVQNEILRSAWLTELARQLSFSEEALRTEMRKSGGKQKGQPSEAPVAARSDVSAVEKLLIGLLLDNPQFLLKAREEIGAEDFQNHKARDIAKHLLDAGDARIFAGQLINFYKEDPESTHIISLACAEVEAVVDKQRTFEDCVVWVKRLRIRNERESLQSQIAIAERAGDKNRINQLLYDFNELNKGMKKIHEKK